MNPLVSVIIPTLNEEKYIESTLKALKNQNYKGKYEIIVVDACSKDRTVKIAKKYADKVISVKKRGIGVGRNVGAREARGEVLLFIDADTVVLFNILEEISKAFEKKNVVGATCPIIPLSSKARDFTIYWALSNFVKTSIKLGKPQIAGICCAYRKDVFERVGRFDERLEAFEDYDLARKIAKYGKIVFLENTLALTSPRRLEVWGRVSSVQKYLRAYIDYIFTGNSFKKGEYKPIR